MTSKRKRCTPARENDGYEMIQDLLSPIWPNVTIDLMMQYAKCSTTSFSAGTSLFYGWTDCDTKMIMRKLLYDTCHYKYCNDCEQFYKRNEDGILVALHHYRDFGCIEHDWDTNVSTLDTSNDHVMQVFFDEWRQHFTDKIAMHKIKDQVENNDYSVIIRQEISKDKFKTAPIPSCSISSKLEKWCKDRDVFIGLYMGDTALFDTTIPKHDVAPEEELAPSNTIKKLQCFRRNNVFYYGWSESMTETILKINLLAHPRIHQLKKGGKIIFISQLQYSLDGSYSEFEQISKWWDPSPKQMELMKEHDIPMPQIWSHYDTR